MSSTARPDASDDPGPFGDAARHLSGDVLERGYAALAPPPRDRGRVALLVARAEGGVRETPVRATLSPEEGVPGDAWQRVASHRPECQLAVMRADVADLIANGQALTLFGDNLFVDLDLSTENLPPGTRLRAGGVLLEVTPEPHNGCLKFRGRFGGDALRLTATPAHRAQHLRGIYMRVIESGEVAVNDPIEVLERGPAPA